MHPPFEIFFLRKEQGSLAGIAQSAGHWNMNDFIMFFQQLIPHLHDIRRRWLRSCNRFSGRKFPVKLF